MIVAHLQHAGKFGNGSLFQLFYKKQCDDNGEVKTQGRGGSGPDLDKISFVFLLFCDYYSIYDHLCFSN